MLPVSIAGRAYNGLDGLALAARLRPDLVITDLRMPGLDGFQLVERLRLQCPCVKSVITSAEEDPMLQQASLDRGADAFIPKARLPDELPSLFARLFPSCDGVLM
jgi:two-component system response regulator YesN